jgi:hypothetical protein
MVAASCQKDSPDVLDNEATGYQPDYQLELKDYIQDKNFFLLSMLLRNDEVRQSVFQNSVLDQYSEQKENALQQSITNCGGNASCLVNALKWSNEEIEEISIALSEMTNTSNVLNQMINEHLRPSGFFEKYKFADNRSFIRQAWADAAMGINFIMDVYVLGEIPKDEVSDGPLYQIGDQDYHNKIFGKAEEILVNVDNTSLFFSINLQLALSLLYINNRDEAGRFEPMQAGENKAAFDKLGTVNFDEYEYSVIVTLGDSPNSAGDDYNISESAKIRVQLASQRFYDGLAPFILFTGANVYPNHSPYHEAIEMKKWAMLNYGIPEANIIVDPHARHTTTNLRNASRLLIRYGFPLEKKGLITTREGQSEYVTSTSFSNNCLNEFGFFPVILGNRISEFDVEFLPKIISLHAESQDPLDP